MWPAPASVNKTTSPAANPLLLNKGNPRRGRVACFPLDPAQQAADHGLLQRAAGGDQVAFAALYDRLSGPLYALCLRMTGDAAEAQDALQEACLLIWRRAPQYDAARNSVFGWAVHLTRGKVIDRLRARGRRLRLFAPDASGDDLEGGSTSHPGLERASGEPDAADVTSQHEQAAAVREVLGCLPGEQRQAIEMAFFGDLTHHEIASRLAQPLGTIKARIRRGLLKLRERLESPSSPRP